MQFRPSMCLVPVRVATAAWSASILLRDDFSAARLDKAFWVLPTGRGSFLGRTQRRPPGIEPVLFGGVAQLQLDTFNPSAIVPGNSFFGTEIATRQFFSLNEGLEFEARVRLSLPLPGGLVESLFSFEFRQSLNLRDEIDFEPIHRNTQGNPSIRDERVRRRASRSWRAAVRRRGRRSGRVQRVSGSLVFPDRVEWYVDEMLGRTESAKSRTIRSVFV